jgi:hypothetical protein
VTNFALVQNRKLPPLEIKNSLWEQWTILIAKSWLNLWTSMMALSWLIASHKLEALGVRVRNSPYSGRLIQLAEIHSSSREQLHTLIQDMNTGMLGLTMQLTRGSDIFSIWLNQAFEETGHLWPCPVVHVSDKD